MLELSAILLPPLDEPVSGSGLALPLNPPSSLDLDPTATVKLFSGPSWLPSADPDIGTCLGRCGAQPPTQHTHRMQQKEQNPVLSQSRQGGPNSIKDISIIHF